MLAKDNASDAYIIVHWVIVYSANAGDQSLLIRSTSLVPSLFHGPYWVTQNSQSLRVFNKLLYFAKPFFTVKLFPNASGFEFNKGSLFFEHSRTVDVMPFLNP